MARATLRKGSQGDDVKHLQTVLNKNGYNLTVDGIFGDKTLAAVQEYQKKNGLSVDGEVGVNTWTSLSKNGGLASDVDFSYDQFKTPTYTESESVTNTRKKWEDAEKAIAGYGDFKFSREEDLGNIMQSILDNKKFSYDLNGDALYQQYKDKYTQQGKMAMRDTMGQAAAMTGGYGNSYAQAVGNQAYQASLDNLNDIVPELYQMAYDRYNQERQDMYNKYGMLSGERENQYGLWLDGLNRAISDRAYYADLHNAERNFDYGKYYDDLKFAYGKYLDDKSYAYNNYANAVANEGKSGGTKEETVGNSNNPNDPAMYSNWTLSDWMGYFIGIRDDGGLAAAEDEFFKLEEAGIIPREVKDTVLEAIRGIRG